MTYFVFQTAFLLLAAYLIGAALGCMLRSLFQDIGDAAAVRAGDGAPGQSDTLRTGVSTADVSGSAAAMATAAVAAASVSESARVASPPVPEEVPDAEQKGTSDASPTSDAPDPISPLETVSDAPGIKLEPSAAAAASSAVLSGVGGAGIAQGPPGTADVADDLKRIRGIGPEVEEILHANGINEYRQIANWSAADIARFSGALNASDRISRENWIEQAQILSLGGITDYAGRIDRGEVPIHYIYDPDSGNGDEKAPDDGQAVAADIPSTGTGTSTGTDATLAAITATGAAAAAAATEDVVAENQERALRSMREAAAADREARTEPEPRETREPRSQSEAREPREPLVSTENRGSGLRSVRSGGLTEPETSGDRGTRLHSTSDIDDLKQIKGIGVTLEKKLNAAGVTTFEEIAGWSSGDITKMNELLSFSGRIERENWTKQAHILAQGGKTEFSERVARGEVQSSLDDDEV